MVSTRLILTGAVLTLAVLATVIQAQENCQRTYRSYTYYWYRYGTWGTRYSRRVSEYYCRYQKTPSTLPDGALRLGSKTISTYAYARGRVEIWRSGSWGTICNRGWSSSDGIVACQQMGYAGMDSRGLIYSISGGSGTVHAQYLYCSSSYEWITQCFSSWGSTCGHNQDVGVYCENKVRVQLQSGSNALQGRAFYWRTNSLRRICDDGFTTNDARVICRQLGFGSLVTYYSDANNYATQRAFGWSYSRSYWLWRLACDGTELYLHHCRNGGWTPTCYGYEDVGVRCNMPTPDVTVTATSSSAISVSVEMMEALRYSARITGFKIRYYKSGSSWITNTYSTSAHTYSRSYTGLEPYTRYYVQATVVLSGITTETWSTTGYATTLEEISQPVRNLMLNVRSATSIYVSWTAPEEVNGLLSAYIVEYQSITPGIEHHVTSTVPSYRRYITLTGLQEHTTYSVSVRVRNGAGESENARDTAKTLEAAPSGPPTGIQARTTGPDTMSVFWEPPQLIQQNGEITGYRVRYRVFGGSYVYADPTDTSYHIESLTPYTTYYISVAAKTSAGTGVYGTDIRQRTAESEPTGAPQNVRITALTAEHLIVTYSAPSTNQQNGIILTYTVEWGVSTTVTADVQVPTSVGLFHRITEAMPYTIYYARVAATTSVGEGPFSDWVSARTLVAAPTSPPRDVSVVVPGITSTSFQVTWSPPETGTNGPIVAYTVIHGLTSNGLPIGTAEVTDREYTVTNLRPFTDFYVSVAAKTTAGEGPFSPNVQLKTLSDVPGAPVSGVSLTPNPNMPNIAVSWTPLPTEFYNDAELTGYVIYYVPSGPDAPSGMEEVGPTETSFTLTGLHQRVAYTIEISAENAQGLGPRSLEQTAITSGQAPDSAPFDLRAWLLNAYSIHLEWTAPRSPEGNLDILHYVVAYEQAGSSDRTEVNIDASTGTDQNYAYDISGLQPWREYIMTVYSVNSVDRSPGSTPYTTRTASAASPIAPTIITSSVFTTSTSVRFMWTEISDNDARGVVIGYNVQYGLQNGAQQTISIAGHVDTHEFPGLTPASDYQFSIAVHNVNGSGPYSDVVYATTKDDIPSTPRQLRADALSPTSVRLYWQPPEPSNGAYVYLLNFTSLHEAIPDSDEIQLNSSLTEFVVEDLEEHVEYEFYLQARTTAGIGDHAIVDETTLEAAPSSPPLNVAVVAINPTAVTVTWEVPPIIHHNSPLTGYVIIYFDLSVLGGELELTIPDPTLYTTMIINLEPYSLYDVQVAALNDAGRGPRSFEVTIETPKTRPPQPTIVDVDSPLSTQMNVTWTLPENPNGVLLGYTLRYEAAYPPDIDSSGEELPGPDATYLLIVDLQPGTSYNIYLLAKNDFNVSDWEQGSGYTLSEVPTASMDMTLEPVTSMAIEVSWTPPNTTDWNGPLKEIIIIYGEGEDNSTEQEKVIPIGDMVEPDDMIGSTEIDQLIPFTEYYFMMVLVNEAGEGPYTEEMRTVTLEDVPGPVENLTVEVQNTNITLTWEPPLVHNGILLTYSVYFDGERYDDVKDDLIMVIPDLEERVQHVVGVAATTVAGEGELTSVQVQTADLPTPVFEAAAGAPAAVYYSMGAVIAIVVLAIIIVLLLGVIAYRRRRLLITKRAKGYAEDDWNLYDDYEDKTVFEGKEGFQVQENQLEHRPQGHATTDGRQREPKAKGSNISSALAGLRRINTKESEAYEDDLSAFDNALDRLRGMGDPFVVHDEEAPILY